MFKQGVLPCFFLTEAFMAVHGSPASSTTFQSSYATQVSTASASSADGAGLQMNPNPGNAIQLVSNWGSGGFPVTPGWEPGVRQRHAGHGHEDHEARARRRARPALLRKIGGVSLEVRTSCVLKGHQEENRDLGGVPKAKGTPDGLLHGKF